MTSVSNKLSLNQTQRRFSFLLADLNCRKTAKPKTDVTGQRERSSTHTILSRLSWDLRHIEPSTRSSRALQKQQASCASDKSNRAVTRASLRVWLAAAQKQSFLSIRSRRPHGDLAA